MDTRKPKKNHPALKPKNFSMFENHHRAEVARNRSLPQKFDLSREKISKLASMWHMNESDDIHPMRIIMDAVHAHLDELNRDFDTLPMQSEKWFSEWKLLYKISQQLDISSRSSAELRKYSVPRELAQIEAHAARDLSKDDIEWAAIRLEYATEIDRRQAEITEIKRKISLIEEAGDIASLSTYDNCPKPKKIEPSKTRAFFEYIFGAPQGSSSTSPIDSTLQQEQLQKLREHVLREYNDNLIFKTNSLNDYADFAPRKPTQHREAWTKIKAKIAHHRTDYLRCISKNVMLQCLQLYITSTRVYAQIFGENPLMDPGRDRQKLPNDDDENSMKCKLLFRQMIGGMRNSMCLLYCLQPSRVDFNTYLDNFTRIEDPDIREALLRDRYTNQMLTYVFPDYESPDDSPESSQLMH